MNTTERIAVDGYVAAMLWVNTTTENFHAVDASGKIIPPGLEQHVVEDVKDFLAVAGRKAPDELAQMLEEGAYRTGFNLALSRNGHGAGFLDYGFRDLNEIAKQMGEESWMLEADGTVVAV